jgi:tRNA(Ile)-lysidine synthase
MDLFQSFTHHWKQTFPQFQQEQVLLLIAVSGGLDSVVLTKLAMMAGFNCRMMHVNFQLRGQESEEDEIFVRKLAKHYGIEIEVIRFETLDYAQMNGIGIQEAARNLRYQWFESIRAQWQLQSPNQTVLILTAHHANDNIETLLMNFFRGTGIQGLRGIAAFQKNTSLVRPLLPFKKEELMAYANQEQLSFVEDSSNASDKYTRNFLRNRFLPQLKEIYPTIEDNLLQNIGRLKEVSEIFQEALNTRLEALMEWKAEECHVPILKLKKTPQIATVIWEIIKPFGFTVQQIPELVKLMDASNGSYLASDSHRVIRNRKWLVIATIQPINNALIVIESTDALIEFSGGILVFTKNQTTTTIDSNPLTACLDLKNIAFPLLLRKPKSGDYFYPLGMQKKKKLNRFFIDQKLSKTQKEAIWILESANKIIWVLGLRIDNRFKCTNTTQSAFHISFGPK